jgi:hypothetical protein
MFAGHVAAALAIGRAEPRLNVGVLVVAALWLDVALWAMVLAGAESLVVPADFARSHQLAFDFPWSHGLIAALAWSALGAGLAYAAAGPLGARPARAAACVGAAVFSHWLLDALVHRPELPLAGRQSPLVGLALGDRMPLALAVEAALVGAGLVLCLRAAAWPRGRAIALAALALAVLAFTVAGTILAPPPPSARAAAGGSLATLVLVCALALWIGRRPAGAAATTVPVRRPTAT